MSVAVVFGAGLVGQSSFANGQINLFGVIALALMGEWFSKTTSDKLQEVFSTLFSSDADKERTDKLKEAKISDLSTELGFEGHQVSHPDRKRLQTTPQRQAE